MSSGEESSEEEEADPVAAKKKAWAAKRSRFPKPVQNPKVIEHLNPKP